MSTPVYHTTSPSPKALIVDDDSLGLITTMEIMSRLGAVTEGCLDPQEAILRARQTAYDYVLLDLQMPKTDGYQLCCSIRSEESKSKNAVIAALSGRIYSKQEVAQCLKAGMNDILSKPITEAELSRRLHVWRLHGRNLIANQQNTDVF